MIKKIKLAHPINLIFTLIALGLLIYLCLAYVGTKGIGLIYSSDILSIPYLYKDLFFNHGSLSEWIFPPTMCFFPDAVAYFILAAIVRNLNLAIALFAIYQLVLYYFLIVYIGKTVTNRKSNACLFNLSVFLTFFLYSAGYLQQNIFYATAFSGHFGTAMMFLLGMILITRTFSSKNALNYIFLAIICILTVFSDMLFVTQFVVTACASLIVMSIFSEKERIKIYTINFWVIAISSLIGYLCLKHARHFFHLHIVHDHTIFRRYHLHDLILATKTIVEKLTIFYQQNADVLLLLFVFFFITLVFLFKIVFNRLKGIKLTKQNEAFIFTILMVFMSILTGYCSLIFLDNNLMSSDPSLRHFQPFVLFPVFLGLPLYLARYTNLAEVVNKYYIAIIIALLSCAFLFAPSRSVSNLVAYYPPQVACVDHYADQYDLKNGVGQYWDAKFMSFLSKKGVNIAAITENQNKIVPYLWYNTLNDYLGKNFNFVVVHDGANIFPTSADITKFYGNPEKILQCPNDASDPISIYIYKNGFINAKWTKQDLSNPV